MYVLQLIVTNNIYNTQRPFLDPDLYTFKCNAFFLDHQYILTINEVANARSIVGRIPTIGYFDLKIEVVSICDKIALCKIIDTTIVKEKIDNNSFKISDSLYLKLSENVIIMGYTQYGNVNTNVCHIVDITSNLFLIDKKLPSCIGSPVMNYCNEIVGMLISEDCMISSRFILNVLDQLKNNYGILKLPDLGITWSNTTPYLTNYLCKSDQIYGIRICDIYSNGFLNKLKTNDIITHIQFIDIYNNKITAYIDRHGESLLYKTNESVLPTAPPEIESPIISRHIKWIELFSLIPLNSTINLQICRNGKWYRLKTEYTRGTYYEIEYIYPKITRQKYHIMAGICFSPLILNNIKLGNNYEIYIRNKYEPRINMLTIFPNTYVYNSQIFTDGDILESINDIKIRTLEDFNLIKNSDLYKFESIDKKLIILSSAMVTYDDTELSKVFN
jgi:hypothetical protein